jgi:hypothetical protein
MEPWIELDAADPIEANRCGAAVARLPRSAIRTAESISIDERSIPARVLRVKRGTRRIHQMRSDNVSRHLTLDDAVEIWRRRRAGEAQHVLAARYQVNPRSDRGSALRKALSTGASPRSRRAGPLTIEHNRNIISNHWSGGSVR